MTKTILSVDDSASIRQMITFTLETEGYRVETAVDGEDGLEKAKLGSFDMILADLNMPRRDGISLIRELRTLPAYRFTPLVMLTTETQAEKKSEAREAGATGWIVKPFEQKQLLAVVRKVLG